MITRLFAAGFITLFVALVIYSVRLRVRPAPTQTEIEVRRNGADWLHAVFVAVGGLPDHRMEAFGSDSLQILWRRRPSWTIAVAVFFFPFGLLALLLVRWEQCSISVTNDGPSSRARIGGVVSQRAVDAINLTLP